MNCPYCGSEMKLGYIQCRDGLYWMENKRAVAAIPFAAGERVNLADDGWVPFGGYSATAYYCRECRKVVIDLSKQGD